MTKKIIRRFLIFTLVAGLSQSFFFATYSLFLQDKGMSFLQMNIINLSFMVASFIFEIPTGAIADLFGRKKSILLGCLTHALAFFIYFNSDNFWIFILAEIIAAIGATMISGALDAWVVDSLAHHNYKDDLENVFRKEKFQQIAIIIGALLGSFVGQKNLAWPWLLGSSGFFVLAIFVAFKFKEDYFQKKKISFSLAPIKKITQESIAFGIKNRVIFDIILFSSLMILCLQGLNMYWAPTFKNHGLSTSTMGLIFAGISISVYLGTHLSKYFKKKINNERKAIILSQLVTATGIIGAALSAPLFPLFAFFFLHEIGRGLFNPIKKAYINRHIPSENRATILSFDSMCTKFAAALGLLLTGLIAQNYSINSAWLVSGIILLVGVFIFLKDITKRKETLPS
ncbi:MAG: MFS transporter [Planctomycetes bacterium]|jgi:MFS family permease|nr:MFS transporter [Planctomycetota bacterium]